MSDRAAWAALADVFDSPISVYTRREAIEDGVLMDCRDGEHAVREPGDLAKLTTEHHGPDTPVVLTQALVALIQKGRFSWFAPYCFAIGLAAVLAS